MSYISGALGAFFKTLKWKLLFFPLKKKTKTEGFPFKLQEQTGIMTTGMKE